MPNMLFHFAEYLKVNLQAKRFERQVHFNVSLKEMHPPSTSSVTRLRSGTDNLINEGGEKRGPRSGPHFSPPVKQIQRSPSEAEGCDRYVLPDNSDYPISTLIIGG
jgi:hypothetical protein